MFGEQNGQHWVAIDEALSHSELKGLVELEFYERTSEKVINEDVMPTLSRLLPKSYRRGVLGRDTEKSALAVDPLEPLDDERGVVGKHESH